MLTNLAIAPASVAGTTYDQAVLADTPLAYWPLNETSGTTANDLSGNGHNGTYAGGFTLGQTGIGDGETAVAFNGSTGKVTTTLNQAFTAMSVEIWVTNWTGQNGRIIANSHTDSDNDGFQFMSSAGSPAPMASVIMNVGKGTANSFADAVKPANGQHYFAATYDGTTITFYIDAVSSATQAFTGTVASGTANVGLAFNPAYNGDFFAGTIAKAAIYSHALTPTRISAHYAAATGTASAKASGMQASQALGRASVI